MLRQNQHILIFQLDMVLRNHSQRLIMQKGMQISKEGMRMKFRLALFTWVGLLSIAPLFASCLQYPKPEKSYQNAVRDASVIGKEEIADNLIAINQANQNLVWNKDKTKILVVTWKSKSSYERFLKPYKKTSTNDEYVIWVTIVPQAQILDLLSRIFRI